MKNSRILPVRAEDITLRQWYAGQALKALVGKGTMSSSPEVATIAFRYADAMIAYEAAEDEKESV